MSPPRILAVDDDPNQLAALKRIFRRSGFEVVGASSGRDGLRKAFRPSPDLILVDVTMPHMSGHEFLRRYRRLEWRLCAGDSPTYVNTPIIFLTGRAGIHSRIDGLDAGANDYVTKPFDSDELRARVRRLLRESRRFAAVRSACQLDQLSQECASHAARCALAACREALDELDLFYPASRGGTPPSLAQVRQNLEDAGSWVQSVLREFENEVAA